MGFYECVILLRRGEKAKANINISVAVNTIAEPDAILI
jgi:hypothetical protein